MHILQLVHSMDAGGLERVVQQLSLGMQKSGQKVSLGCLDHAGVMADVTIFENIWIGQIKKRLVPIDFYCLLKLIKFVRCNNIDMIHSHNPQPLLYGTLARILTGVPIVHTVHGRGKTADVKRQRKAFIRRNCARFTRKFVAISDDVRTKLQIVDRIPPNKLVTILNGVEIPSFDKLESRQKARISLGLPQEKFIIGSIGRFCAEKNYVLLVEAFKNLCCMTSNAHLVIVGDGSEMPEVVSAVKNHGLEKAVTLPGMQRKVTPWLRAMDVFCLSSTTEGTAMALLEAGATGIPAVVTDVGGNTEVVLDGKTGLVVPPGDANAMSAAFARLVRDGELRISMGHAARERVQKMYSVDTMVDDYLDIYRKILSL